MERAIPKIPKGKTVDQWSVADPWYGKNISKIIETPEGKFFKVSYNDGHGPHTKWTRVVEVYAVPKMEWKEAR